jgi:hypothetical protein
VNDHWIVRHGLKKSAAAYLDYLEANDPQRLRGSCRRARRLVSVRPPREDPKPWFYAGLFSLATVEEGRLFLADHWFTTACIPALATLVVPPSEPVRLGADTRRKIMRIQEALAGLR